MPYRDKEKALEYQRKYLSNPDNRARHDESVKRSKERYFRWLADLKNHPCMDCGGSFPSCAMEWHHRPGEEKLFHFGTHKRSRKMVLAEIEKCDLLCANCHRIRHYG